MSHDKAARKPSDVQQRSNRREVRNPVLALPAVTALRALPPEAKAALRAVLLELAADAQRRGQECWCRRKAPMAAYWMAVGVYSRHIARAMVSESQDGRQP